MISIPGYAVLDVLYESVHSLTVRARSVHDGQTVIVKTLKDEHPPPREVQKYKTEFELATELAGSPGIIRVLALEKVHHSLAMIVEDFGGESLKILLRKRTFPLTELLEIGIKIASCLGEIHARKIIHKDVNPANIVYNPSTAELKLIDFGIATRLLREAPGFESPAVVEGTLAYISPEQTGRMNRSSSS